MAFVYVPVTDDVARGSFVTELSGEQYRINYNWSTTANDGEGAWSMDLIGSRVTLFNLKLVGGADLLDAYGISDILDRMIVLDTTGLQANPTRNDMGPTKRFRILYGTF